MANVSDPHSEVTSVIRHKIKEGEQAAYETWLREIVPLAAHSTGHRGVNVIRPPVGSTEYTVILHFDTIDNLRAWLDSDVRRDLIAKALPLLAGEDDVEIKTGLEFWFTPPSSKAKTARPWKQFLVTLSAIYPLSMLVPFLYRPVFVLVPFPGAYYVQALVIAATLVALLTYVIMPRYARAIAAWLYR